MKPVKRSLRQIPGPSWKLEKSPIPPRRSERIFQLDLLRAKASIDDSKGFYAHLESMRNRKKVKSKNAIRIALQKAVVQEIKNFAHPPANVSVTVMNNAEAVGEDFGCQGDLNEPRRTTAPPSESGAHEGQQQGRDGQTGSLDAVDDSAPVSKEGRNTAALITNRLLKIEPDDIHDFRPDQMPFLVQEGNSTTYTTTSEAEYVANPVTRIAMPMMTAPPPPPCYHAFPPMPCYVANPGTLIAMPMMTTPPPPPCYHAFPPMPCPCHPPYPMMTAPPPPPCYHAFPPMPCPCHPPYPMMTAPPPPPCYHAFPPMPCGSQCAAMYSGQGQPLRTQNLPSPSAFLPMAPRSVPGGFPQMIFHQFAPPPFHPHPFGLRTMTRIRLVAE